MLARGQPGAGVSVASSLALGPNVLRVIVEAAPPVELATSALVALGQTDARSNTL